jgi:DNA adenine methylase
MKKYKSPINWYGGKYYMAKDIIEIFPEHNMYVEGFGGAGHVLFRKERSNLEVYNDLHSGLYLIFKFLREGNMEFIHKLSLTPYSRQEFEDSKSWICEVDEVEKARKFYTRTMQSVASNGGWCYAKSKSRRGMCQSVSRWLGNIEENLSGAIDRLKEVQIENLDVIELIRKYDKKDTLFYLDPPYITETRKQKKSYDHEMTDAQHEELVEVLLNVKGKVVLSGYDHPIYNKLLENGWEKVVLGEFSKRSQKTNDGKLDEGKEFVWINYPDELSTFIESDNITDERIV